MLIHALAIHACTCTCAWICKALWTAGGEISTSSFFWLSTIAAKYTSCHNILYPAAIIEANTTQDTYVLTDGGTAVVNCSATGGVAPANMTFHTPTGVLLTDTGSHGPGDHFYLSSTTLTQLNTSDSPLYQAWRTLTISGAAFEDSGNYTCSAANGTVEDTTNFDIFVEGTSSIIMLYKRLGMGETDFAPPSPLYAEMS